MQKLFLGCSVLFFLACQSCKQFEGGDKVENQFAKNGQKMFVESFAIEEWMPELGKAVVSIKGILPNPSYSVDFVDVKIHKNKIMLTPWMTQDTSLVVIQMTVPFEKRVEITGLKSPQHYSVHVVAENKVAAKELTW